ncbi:hypothetical protein AVEN_127823-1 [Araneus ventricosus]|uniref:Helitron helicase-like domain-containing protein n=1 Tax=Araneus ventricosus TaxID=182803 RepID=A0A4Y1ZYJ4_ARAVE|nr:hypothetical protein AVEN_127823-1 [Araneus ventricosus]
MSLQDLYYNLRRRELRSNESLDEALQRRSARNETDRFRVARKSSDQLSQRRAIRVHSRGNMSEVCEFCGALYWKNEANSSKKYTKCCHDGKVRLPNLTEAPDLSKKETATIHRKQNTIDSIFENIMLHQSLHLWG